MLYLGVAHAWSVVLCSVVVNQYGFGIDVLLRIVVCSVVLCRAPPHCGVMPRVCWAAELQCIPVHCVMTWRAVWRGVRHVVWWMVWCVCV